MEDDNLYLDTVSYSLEHLHSLAAAEIFHNLAGLMQDIELTFSQVAVLQHLYSNGPQSISVLAETAHLSHAATSRLVNRLVNAGFVSRHSGLTDRRQKQIEIADRGLELFKAVRSTTQAAYVQVLASVPKEKVHKLADDLSDVTPHLPPHLFDKDSE